MNKVLITGGTGTLGRAQIKVLEQHNVAYRFTSRSRPTFSFQGEWLPMDMERGTGISEAVEGIHTVMHLASDTQTMKLKTDVEGTRQLLEACQKAGVKHFIFISIVGTDITPLKYYRMKVATEKVVEQFSVPYSILRATQFHEFLDFMLGNFFKAPFGLLPKSLQIQPVQTEEVAKRLFEMSQQSPTNSIENLGGREILSLNVILKKWLAARKENKLLCPIPAFGKAMSAVANGSLTCPEVAKNSISWEEWLWQKYG